MHSSLLRARLLDVKSAQPQVPPANSYRRIAIHYSPFATRPNLPTARKALAVATKAWSTPAEIEANPDPHENRRAKVGDRRQGDLISLIREVLRRRKHFGSAH